MLQFAAPPSSLPAPAPDSEPVAEVEVKPVVCGEYGSLRLTHSFSLCLRHNPRLPLELLLGTLHLQLELLDDPLLCFQLLL